MGIKMQYQCKIGIVKYFTFLYVYHVPKSVKLNNGGIKRVHICKECAVCVMRGSVFLTMEGRNSCKVRYKKAVLCPFKVV